MKCKISAPGLAEESNSPQSLSTGRAISLLQFRRITHLAILAIAIATLILSLIYSWCVDHFRTNKDAIIGNLNTRDDWDSDITSTNSSSTSDALSADITTLPSVGFFFYSATLPLLSLFYTCGHLLSQLLRNSNCSGRSTKPFSFLCDIIISLIFLLGWITTSIFWIHCELPGNSHLSAASTAVCPAALRQHFMYGIREVSVAKACSALLIILLNVVDIVITIVLWRKPLHLQEGILCLEKGQHSLAEVVGDDDKVG